MSLILRATYKELILLFLYFLLTICVFFLPYLVHFRIVSLDTDFMSVNQVVCFSWAQRSRFSMAFVTNAASKLCRVPVFLLGSLSEEWGQFQLRGVGGLTRDCLLILGDSVWVGSAVWCRVRKMPSGFIWRTLAFDSNVCNNIGSIMGMRLIGGTRRKIYLLETQNWLW